MIIRPQLLIYALLVLLHSGLLVRAEPEFLKEDNFDKGAFHVDEEEYLKYVMNGSRPIDYKMDASFTWNFPKTGGFTAEKGKCPEGFYIKNNYCWVTGTDYRITLKNNFMEYYDASDDFREVDAHYSVIFSKAGKSVAPYMPVKLYHTRQAPITIFLADGRKLILRNNDQLELKTNAHGKLIVAVLNEQELRIPALKVWAPFMDLNGDVPAFKVTTHALHKLVHLEGSQLRQGYGEHGPLLKGVDQKTADSTAEAISNLFKPIYYGQTKGKSQRLTKRGFFETMFTRKQNRKKRKPFIQDKGIVRPMYVHRDNDLEDLLEWDHHEKKHLELRFGHDSSQVDCIHHSEESIALRSNELAVKYNGLMKRSYFSDLGQKIKQAAISVKNLTKAAVVDVPKALFNVTAMKEGKQVYVDQLNGAVSNATKLGVQTTRDVIATLPLGDIVNDKMGINDLVARINSSDTIIITPLTYGIELVLLGPQTANKHLIESLEGIWAVIKGLLSKIGVTIAAMFQFIKSLFNWDDILLNHSVLNSHYRKMIPYIKAAISGSHGNLTNSFVDVVNRLDNFTGEAVDAVTSGQFAALPDLISKANKEIYTNATLTPELEELTNFDDIQADFISDHIASSSMSINIAKQDQANILVLLKDVFKEIATVGEESFTELKDQWNDLIKELSQSAWSLNNVFSIIWRMMRFLVKFILVKLLQAILLVFDLYITFLDKILRARPEIPLISGLYRRITKGSDLSLYGIFALTCATPVTIAFKMFNGAKNMFTKQEASVLIATTVPEYYVENLVAFAMQVPGQSPSKLRNMYRRTVSYILGSGYATGQLLSTAVGAFVNQEMLSYILRAPLELLAITCNYPWSWYTETKTTIGVNVRFLTWALQFVPFFTRWPTLGTVSQRVPWLTMLIALCVVVPNIYMVIRVWMEDIKLLRSGAPNDGSTTYDVTLKGIARLVSWIPRLLLAVHDQPDQFFATLRLMIFGGAVLQNVRLYTDIPMNAIYSV